jgi:hypothetical protein
VPDSGEKIVLADYTIAVAYQKCQDIKDLGFDRDWTRAASKLLGSGI